MGPGDMVLQVIMLLLSRCGVRGVEVSRPLEMKREANTEAGREGSIRQGLLTKAIHSTAVCPYLVSNPMFGDRYWMRLNPTLLSPALVPCRW